MDPIALCLILEEALERLGVEIRQEKMPEEVAIAGGLCVIKGALTVIVSSSASASERAEVFINALRKTDNESIWLPPAIREIIDSKNRSSYGVKSREEKRN